MKKIYYFIPVISIFLTYCSGKEQVASDLRLNDSDSMSLMLSKWPQFTSVNDSSVAKFRFQHFADVEKLAARLPKDFSRKIYLEKMDTLSLQEMTTSRMSLCEWTGDEESVYGALHPYYESENYIPVLAESAGPAGEYKVEAIVNTLNPFFSYLIRYNLVEDYGGYLESNGHSVSSTGINPLNCMTMTDVGGIDELVEPHAYIYTYVYWTSNLNLLGSTLSVPLGIRLRADVPL